IVVNALEREGINGYKFYQHLKKDRKDFGQKWFKEQECVICTSGSIQTVLTCPTRAVGYCGPCSIQLLLASRKEFSTGQLQCPCCRQPGYLIATEWIFVQDEEARDRHKAEYQKQRRQQRKIRIKEQKSVQQYEEAVRLAPCSAIHQRRGHDSFGTDGIYSTTTMRPSLQPVDFDSFIYSFSLQSLPPNAKPQLQPHSPSPEPMATENSVRRIRRRLRGLMEAVEGPDFLVKQWVIFYNYFAVPSVHVQARKAPHHFISLR
ncbi:hypothetical protein BT96DRAFT_952064, partial [Gymnopus androsaceus JB14]